MATVLESRKGKIGSVMHYSRSLIRMVAVALPLTCFTIACSKRDANSNEYRLPNCPRLPAITDERTIKASFGTASGMYGIWRPNVYVNICKLSDWDLAFVKNEAIEAYIRRGSFVPLYLHENGESLIEVRIGSVTSPAAPTKIESDWSTQTSDAYLFQSDGVLALSGIEFVNGSPNAQVHAVPLPAGRWVVIVRQLAPPHEPSGKNDRVPNLLVIANPEPFPAPTYRTLVDTFSIR